MLKKNKLAVASLGSGSKGNATLVTNGQTTVLIDCGFSLKETLTRLEKIGVSPQKIDALVVTHEHQDHIKGIGPLSRKFNIPVWTTRGTFLSERCGDIAQVNYIKGFEPFTLGSLEIIPIPVAHDAREPCQFVFYYNDFKLAVLTDLGSLTVSVIDYLAGCHGLVLEFNYDEEMLWNGIYPESLKRRVAGNFGHLSNKQSIQLLQKSNIDSLQWIIASHLSEVNNCPQIVNELIQQELQRTNKESIEVVIAMQQEGYSWKSIN